ncbi:hypothetical protein BGW36DRAFT_364788 [Talaromyces proteolyticus]|uniref:Uncharacterized protein n=1 Tax=Talaromyces proteolyticus TaxID=1131652 RepID=A0AAD4PV97_9EURO|nr:uncharacterized protein BGW36DRAFT_364788 [Talaromyces proteolyticus]KAH8690058.1 hypothetical protein BGW36DRAFT_364788 [Talaromyces proteolyticus]
MKKLLMKSSRLTQTLAMMKEMDGNTSREPLLMESDREYDESSHELNEKNDTYSPFFTYKSLSVLIANFLLLILSVVILVFAKLESSRQSSLCTKEHSFYSPALEEVKYEKVRYAGLLESDSLWRGSPSPIIDEAWDSVTWKVPEIPVDESVVHRTNNQFDINSLTRFPPEFGGQIYTEVEWKHELHCLNLMRKYIYFDYYKNSTSLFYAYSSDEIINHLGILNSYFFS